MATERIGKAVLELVTDGAKFFADIEKAKKEAKELHKSFETASKGLKDIGGGVSDFGTALSVSITAPVTAAVGGLIALAVQTSKTGDAIANNARQAGLGRQAYQELAFALGQAADMTEEEVTKAFGKLSTVIGDAIAGNKTAIDSLKAIGFTQQEIASGTITTEEAFNRLNRTMQDTANAGEAAAIAGNLVGDRLGPKLAGQLREGGAEVDQLRQQFRDLGLALTDEQIDAAADFDDQLNVLTRQLGALGRVVGAEVLPALQGELMPFLIDEAVPAARTLAEWVGKAVKVFLDLPRPVQFAALAIGGVAVAAGPTLIVLGQLTSAAGSVVGAVGKLAPLFISTGAAGKTGAVGITFFSTSVKTLTGVLLGPVGLIAALGGLAVAYTFLKTRQLREDSEVLTQATEILKRAVKNATEAREIIEAFQKGQAGQPLAKSMEELGRLPGHVVEAWNKGAEAAGRLAAAQGVVVGRFAEAGKAAEAAKTPHERLREAQERLTEANRLYREELAKGGEAMKFEIRNMDALGTSVERIAKNYGVSEQTIRRYQAQLKESAKAEKEAETNAERHAKALEKQRAALEKLGIVTERGVNDALDELAQLQLNAEAGGAKHNIVLAAMLPLYEELRSKAVASGVGVDVATRALENAKTAAAALTEEFKRLIPALPIEPLREIPGEVVGIASESEIQARRIADAFERAGLQTRAELRRTAEQAIDDFNLILQSGAATPQQIQERFERMVEAVNEASGEIPSFWRGEVVPLTLDAVNDITRGVSDGLAAMLFGLETFGDGWRGIWQSIVRSTLSLVSDMIGGILRGLSGRLLRGLMGGGAGGGLANGATSAAGGFMPGLFGAGGLSQAGLASLLNVGMAGGAGFGLGMLGKKMFGGAGAGAGIFGGLSGGLLGGLAFGGPVGALVGGGVGLLTGLFGMNSGRNTVKDWVKENFGDFDALRKRLDALPTGVGERLWKNLTQGVGRNNPEQAKRAIADIERALGDLAQREATFNQGLTGNLQRIAALGGSLPESIQGYLESLAEAGRLTEDNIALLAQIKSDGKPTWQQLQEAVERYGGDISKLGGAFQEQRLHDLWQQVIDDIDLFERGLIDANDILNLTKEKIIELVQQSIKFGTEIPENMRPWIQSLIDSGELIDENGEKITDINQLTFGGTLKTTLEELRDAILVLIDTLRGVPPAAQEAVDGWNEAWDGANPPPHLPDPVTGDPGPGPVAMAEGGFGRVTKPTLFLAGEAGPEEFAFSGAHQRFDRAAASSSGSTTIIFEQDGRRAAEFVVPHIPRVARRFRLHR